MEVININVGVDFSKVPGPRYRDEGPFSGEQFRDEILEPAFLKSKEKGLGIIVNLDGVAGYATSFLEESFGGLARKYGSAEVSSLIKVISHDEPYLIDDIADYINHASD